ncbi:MULTISPECIES: FadR/GntR family transcriptional regulator [unclassified Ensifer]|uniref:FadR/GntR family transcriptional regulator n=1 Tax=unclassified Ensifer TaxID=2633371 RepID=UPI00081383D7|nr:MULTISPECIES: FadR/GntR family transcriptional regulator [unclassified Ensifer]OCP15603.1 GntR family transcriptional regulator [Ensifer sp. LC163]OCP19152.1 GntR family transcriptional regulator [Ensifer sp. LC54]OCP27308.1 GntR family transcriptional regulator [Ensifer sp. LC384]
MEGQEPQGAAEEQVQRRPRVQKNVTRTIASDICADIFPVGSYLPRENDLCERYGVSRTVIRESLKILESKGMVRGRSRVGTIVCGKDEWNILDAQVLEWIGERIFEFDLLNCILEARRAIEPVAAEFAAERATVQEIADLERAWQAMRDGERDIAGFTDADVAFHTCLLKASHNQVFLQLVGIIQAALKFSLHASNEAAERRDEAIDIHRELVEALRMRDKAAARDCSTRMLNLAARDLATAVQQHRPVKSAF